MRSKRRIPVPLDTKRKLLLYCRHECCLCDTKVSGVRESNIHHINQNPSDNRLENLILLCPNCHAKADRGDFLDKHLKIIRDSKVQKLGIRDFVEQIPHPEADFKTVFTAKLSECVNLLSSRKYSTRLNDLIDELIMLIKDRIEKWDVPSVRFATKELFMNLYRYSEKEGFCDLYTIFKDLFDYAYSQRKHLLGSMIEVFNLILFESWVPKYDVERGERGAKVLLKLALKFLDEDLAISEGCFTSIDNLAGDMFEPEILSKEVILGAVVLQKKSKSIEMENFFRKIVDYIKWNDQYAWDDGDYRYLIESLKWAEADQSDYSVDIRRFKEGYLFPIIEHNINKNIDDFVEFLSSAEYDKESREFAGGQLCDFILSYGSFDPKIQKRIRGKIAQRKNTALNDEFNMIIGGKNFLKKVFRGSEMITTLEELIRFLEKSSDIDNVGIGVTTYGSSWVRFDRKLDKKEKKDLEEIAKKYKLNKGLLEIEEQSITFEMDHLVYLGNNKHDMKQLIQFLNEIKRFSIKSITTGITFELRELAKVTQRSKT